MNTTELATIPDALVPQKLPVAAYLTKPARDALDTLFKRKMRPMPALTEPKKEDANDAFHRVVEFVNHIPEYHAAVTAVKALSARLAGEYGCSLELVDIQISSDGSFDVPNYSTSSYHEDYRKGFIQDMRNKAHNLALLEYEPLREAERQAQADWKDEYEQKRVVIRTANTIDVVMQYVPECRVNLPTNADRERNTSQGYRPGDLTETPGGFIAVHIE